MKKRRRKQGQIDKQEEDEKIYIAIAVVQSDGKGTGGK